MEQTRNRGRLFDNPEKRRPSQPDMRGNCTLEGAKLEMLGFLRHEQLSITLAPPRGDSNRYPPDLYRGALDPAPAARGEAEAPTWVGEIVGDESRFTVHAFEKQGKSGSYLTLLFDRVEG